MLILIVEDDPVTRRVLEATVREWGYDVMVAHNGVAAWEIIKDPDTPNLVISDWLMPCMDGLTLCRKIRQLDAAEYIYFILLTAKEGQADLLEGLKAGADDFLTKPFHPQELKYRIRIGERIIRLKHNILELARTDVLTGLLNRRALMERMEQEIQRSMRENNSFSLILSDIDYFKKVNDTFGHQAGDLVLQKFSDQLSTLTRTYDFIGRYGGEEFIACLPGAGASQAEAIAERMRKRVEAMTIRLPDDSGPVRVTASFGVASLRTKSGDTLDSMIKRADDALYRAKEDGRNRVATSSEMDISKLLEDRYHPGTGAANDSISPKELTYEKTG
ncbi:MAG: diguanylate cyclase [Desulfobacterales bacterium]|nr:diguanylate cyclase [Desulfobacterales bacterium]